MSCADRLAEAYHHAQDPRGSSKRETRLEDAYRAWREVDVDRDEADAYYAELKARLDERAPA